MARTWLIFPLIFRNDLQTSISNMASSNDDTSYNCRNGSEPFKRTVLTVLTACLSSSIFVHSPFPSLSYFIFHLPSSTLIFLHLFSFSFIHLSLFAFINLHSPSFIFINYNSDSFTFICLHSHSFYVTNFHLTS